MAPPPPGRRRWPVLIGLYLFGLAVNLVGITWGLPGHDGGLLPPAPPSVVAEGADRSWAVARDPERNLNLVAPDPAEEETPARTLRRFYLYSSDPDEVLTMMALARVNPLAGRWNPGITQYGGSFLYPLGAWLKLWGAAGAVTLRGDPSFYVVHPDAMGRVYLAGRLFVALVGAAAVPLAYLIACTFSGGWMAAVAAAVAGLAPAWLVWSRVLKPWAYGAPFALAALLLGQALIETRRPRRAAVWAGIFSGLAAGAGLPYAPFLLGPLLGIAMRRQESVSRRLRWAAVTGGTAGAVLLLAQPYWLMDPARTLAALRWLAVGWGTPAYGPQAFITFTRGTLAPAVGAPLLAAGLAEGAWQLWRCRASRPILAPVFLLLLFFAVRTGSYSEEPLFARWILPSTLVVAASGAGAIARVARTLPRALRPLPAALLIPTLLISAGIVRNFLAAAGTGSTRHAAGRLLNGLPEGATIGVVAPLAPFRSPFFRMDRYRLVILPDPGHPGAAPAPDYFLLAERSELSKAPAFLSRYQEVRRFAPPRLPLGATAFGAYPFADPPISIYARRNPGE